MEVFVFALDEVAEVNGGGVEGSDEVFAGLGGVGHQFGIIHQRHL